MIEKEIRLLENDLGILIKGCKTGDRRYQKILYDRFSGKMMTVCVRYAPTREDAEDCLQEGFVKVFNHISEFKSEGSFEGWLRRIMVNTCLEKYRKTAHPHLPPSMNELSNMSAPGEDILSRLAVKELINLIQELPYSCRMVFNLYVFEGLKHAEISKKLGISEGTSKSNLSDARRKLQKMIMNNQQINKGAGNKNE